MNWIYFTSNDEWCVYSIFFRRRHLMFQLFYFMKVKKDWCWWRKYWSGLEQRDGSVSKWWQDFHQKFWSHFILGGIDYVLTLYYPQDHAFMYLLCYYMHGQFPHVFNVCVHIRECMLYLKTIYEHFLHMLSFIRFLQMFPLPSMT